MSSPSKRVGSGSEIGVEGGQQSSAPETETSEGHAAGRRGRTHSSNNDDADKDTQRAKSKNYYQLGRYHDLVSTYISGNASHYATLLTKMSDLLYADYNWGMAKRLDGRLVYRSVRRVANVYSVVDCDILKKRLQEECSDIGFLDGEGGEGGRRKVEDALMGMVACDWDDMLVQDPFFAKVNQLTNIVSFQPNDNDTSTNSDNDGGEEKWMEHDLTQRSSSCIALAERIRDLDVNLTTLPKYQLTSEFYTFGRSPGPVRSSCIGVSIDLNGIATTLIEICNKSKGQCRRRINQGYAYSETYNRT